MDGTTITTLFILGGLAFIYFVPTVTAFDRGHRQRVPILVINFGLGWTLIAWVGCLAWALMEERRS